MKEYKDERFCDNCDDDTDHNCIDSGHERDSSGDMQTCTVCNWYKSGWGNGSYSPPIQLDND